MEEDVLDRVKVAGGGAPEEVLGVFEHARFDIADLVFDGGWVKEAYKRAKGALRSGSPRPQSRNSTYRRDAPGRLCCARPARRR